MNNVNQKPHVLKGYIAIGNAEFINRLRTAQCYRMNKRKNGRKMVNMIHSFRIVHMAPLNCTPKKINKMDGRIVVHNNRDKILITALQRLWLC